MNDQPPIASIERHGPAVHTPCIGVCSASSQGDLICLGCFRYDFEVDHWHHYSELEKKAVLNRIHQLTQLVLQDKIIIVHPAKLTRTVLDKYPKLRHIPHCSYGLLFEWWRRQGLESLLAQKIIKAGPSYLHLSTLELAYLIKKDTQKLCKAHYDRYIKPHPD